MARCFSCPGRFDDGCKKILEEQLQLLLERSKSAEDEILPAITKEMRKLASYLEYGNQSEDVGLALPVASLSGEDLEALKAVRAEKARQMEARLREQGVEFS